MSEITFSNMFALPTAPAAITPTELSEHKPAARADGGPGRTQPRTQSSSFAADQSLVTSGTGRLATIGFPPTYSA